MSSLIFAEYIWLELQALHNANIDTESSKYNSSEKKDLKMNKLARRHTSSALRQHNWQAPSLLDIGTRKIFNEEHDLFRQSCRAFWRSIDPARVRAWEAARGADPSIWKEAGNAGLLCIDTPEEYGGIGADFSFCAVTTEEQAYAGPDFFGPGLGLHTSIVAPYSSVHYGKVILEFFELQLNFILSSAWKLNLITVVINSHIRTGHNSRVIREFEFH